MADLQDAPPPRPHQFENPDFSNASNYCAAQEPSPNVDSLPYWRFWTSAGDATGEAQFDFDFLASHTGFEAENDDTWQPWRFLGSGTFGVVGGWVKRDDTGAIIDEIAVKEMHSSKMTEEKKKTVHHHLWNPPQSSNVTGASVFDQSEGLLREAVIQRQLNQASCENIIHLRGFKYFKTDRAARPAKSWRFYQELAPYGTLEDLTYRYRYYNQFLPEAFLWHVAYSLLECADVMLQCSHDGLPPLSYPPNKTDQVVNFDIKTGNIFIGYTQHRKDSTRHGGSSKHDYPVIKMGDFGLSFFTGKDDPFNPSAYFPSGTKWCRPPEQVHYGMYWQQPPNGPYKNLRIPAQPQNQPQNDRTQPPDDFDADNSDNFSFKFSEKLHVWAIGMVLYELMSLCDASEYWHDSAESQYGYIANGNRQIPDFSSTPFSKHARNKDSPYSSSLTQFVEACMTTEERTRPDVQKLRDRARRRMEMLDYEWTKEREERDKDSADRGVEHPKLYWRPDEINDMPEGQEAFSQTINDFLSMKFYHNYDPDWPSLVPKFFKSEGLADDDDWYRHASNHHEAWGMYKLGQKRNVKTDFVVDKTNPQDWRIRKKLVTGTLPQAGSSPSLPPNQNNPIPRPSNSGSRISKSLRGRKIHYKKADIKPGKANKGAKGAKTAKDKAQKKSTKNRKGKGMGKAKGKGKRQAKQRRQTPPQPHQAPPRRPTLRLSQISSPTSSLTEEPADLYMDSPPPLSPIDPSIIPTDLWAPSFTVAYNNAVSHVGPVPTNRLPPLPPDVDPTDDSFRWDTRHGPGQYVRDRRGVMYFWNWRPRPYHINRGEWIEVEVWPDTPENRARQRVGLPRIRGG